MLRRLLYAIICLLLLSILLALSAQYLPLLATQSGPIWLIAIIIAIAYVAFGDRVL